MKRLPKLPSHHQAWLDAHPEKTEEWFRAAIEAGFDVHHGDSVHSNNHPDNLFLIERTDHMRLHGLFNIRWRAAYKRTRRPPEIESGVAENPATKPQETTPPIGPFVHPLLQDGEQFLGDMDEVTFQQYRWKTKRRASNGRYSAPCFAQRSEIDQWFAEWEENRPTREAKATERREKQAATRLRNLALKTQKL